VDRPNQSQGKPALHAVDAVGRNRAPPHFIP
jgi:hypothetical protein